MLAGGDSSGEGAELEAVGVSTAAEAVGVAGGMTTTREGASSVSDADGWQAARATARAAARVRMP